MISKIYRFHGYGSLKYLFAKGQTARSRDMVIRYVANPRRRLPRFTVIVSKKVHKSAVVRNRIRRRIYELVRHSIDSIDPLYDVAVIVRSASVAEMPANELTQQVASLFQRSGIKK